MNFAVSPFGSPFVYIYSGREIGYVLAIAVVAEAGTPFTVNALTVLSRYPRPMYPRA